MEHHLTSGSLTLHAHLSRPPGTHGGPFPAVVIGHGYPSNPREAQTIAGSFPELAERIAHEMGWIALALELRGVGKSEGNFSLEGWLDDLLAGVDHLMGEQPVSSVWVAGFGTTGALAICAGARDPRVRGVAALAAPADFDDWAGHPRRLAEHAREVGVIHDASFPPSLDVWGRSIREMQALRAARQLAPRPLLLVHGSDDDLVPPLDARAIGDAHGGAEIRMIDGAGHQLRHDPRAVAVLLGWLDRQHHARRSA